MKLGLSKFAAFLATGVPAFLLAVPLNYILVNYIGLSHELSYVIVLLISQIINFVLVKIFVFRGWKKNSPQKQVLYFVVTTSLIRLLDWLVYVVMVEYASVYFIVAQLTNVVAFSVLRFCVNRIILK
jgi:putative flippase GtrA